MVRGIAVMRRRSDAYVNATQILKVAGIDKGRRTKILEKEILPGKHEIVQGGYGKYQGTWCVVTRLAQAHTLKLLTGYHWNEGAKLRVRTALLHCWRLCSILCPTRNPWEVFPEDL